MSVISEGRLHTVRYSLFVGLMSCCWAATAATVSIADIQLVEGEAVVEITGSGFGPGPKVDFFDDFEGGDEGDKLGTAPIRVGTLSVNRPPVYVTYGSDREDTGILIRDRSLTSQLLQATIEFPVASEIFLHFAVHIPPGHTFPAVTDGDVLSYGSTSNWKLTWIMMGDRGDASPEFDMCVPTNLGTGVVSVSGNSGRFFYPPKMQQWWDFSGINHVSFWMKKSPTSSMANVASAYWRTLNKAFGLKQVNQAEKSAQTEAEIKFDRVKIPGWFRTNDSDNFNAVYDNIYVATGPNAMARIEITDKQTPEASSFVMVVPPTSWESGRISFRVPAVVAKAREEFFVRIYNAAGEASDNAMRICLNCPRPPQLQ